MRALFKRLLTQPSRRLASVCRNNDLRLDETLNLPGIPILEAIFNEREYADYFPFYQDAIVVDVGAHYGYFSLFATKNLGAGARVFALEPARVNFEVLTDNLERNGIGNVTTRQVALADNDGTVALNLGRAENHSVVPDYALGVKGGPQEQVRSQTLTAFLQAEGLEKVDFLKLDCEGAEYDILLDAPTETMQKIATVSLEFHDLKSATRNGGTLCKALKNYGFRIVKFTHEPSRWNLNYGKIVAIRG